MAFSQNMLTSVKDERALSPGDLLIHSWVDSVVCNPEIPLWKGLLLAGVPPNQIPTHHDTYQLPCLYLPLFNDGSTFCMSLRTLRLKPWWFEVRAEQKKKDTSRCEHLRITVRADSTRPVKQAWEYKMCEMWVNSELSWALGPIEHCSLSLSLSLM